MPNNKKLNKLINLKNLIVPTLLFIILGITTQLTHAAGDRFSISLFREIQNPQTKEFELKAIVDSEISSDRVTVNWQLPEGLDSFEDTVQSDLSLDTGNNEFYLSVIPESRVNGVISVTIQAFESEKRYSSTQSGEIKTDRELNVTPLSPIYRQMSSAINLRSLSINLLIIFIISFVVLIILKKVLIKRQPRKIPSKSPTDSTILKELSTLRTKQESEFSEVRK